MAFAGIAVFADILGLDPSRGWGRMRIILLIFGFVIVSCTVLYLQYTTRAHYLANNKDYHFVSVSYINRSILKLSRLFKEYWFTLPFLVFVILIYIWFISSGTWTTWVSPTHYYADLTIGFLKGNLYLPIKVGPDLLKSPDPYEPLLTGKTQGPIDYSYYHGKYYLYWGPVPALLLLMIHPIIYWRVGDLQLVFCFVVGLYIVQCLLALAIWDSFFSDLPKYILCLSILLLGLASPVNFILNNYKGARIYEASITGGQFFLMSGFILALTTLKQPASRWRLAFAGMLWALAIGTRFIVALPIGLMVLMVTGWMLWLNHWSLKKNPEITFLSLPIAFGFVCLGWYNWARFGSVTESGLFYQLPGAINLQKHYGELINPIYILQNLYNYFLYPFSVRFQFPYLYAEYGNTKAIFSSYHLPVLYSAQAITGLIYTVPFIVFSLIPVGRNINNFYRKKTLNDRSLSSDEQSKLNWVTLTLSGACLAIFGFLLSFFWVAMRYLEDVMPLLIMLSIVGFWQGFQALSKKPIIRRLYTSLGVVLAVASILLSTLVALSINQGRFEIIHLLSLTK